MNESIQYRFLDSSIGELLERDSSILWGLDCIVTRLDSGGHTYRVLSDILGKHEVKLLGDYGVVRGDVLTRDSKVIFFGFDELYAVEKNAWKQIDPIVFSTSFTSERARFETGIPNAFVNAFKAARAVEYMSDGVGMNIATASIAEMKRIIAALE